MNLFGIYQNEEIYSNLNLNRLIISNQGQIRLIVKILILELKEIVKVVLKNMPSK